MTEIDPRITKKRVTCRSVTLGADGASLDLQKVDYVREDLLEAYLAHMHRPIAEGGEGWQHVEVSEEYDAGPGGYDGETHVPAIEGLLDHPDVGTVLPATPGSETEAAINASREV